MPKGKRVGFFICHCGGNISNVVDIEAVKEYAQGLAGVKVVYDYMFICSVTGQETIREYIKKHNLERVVIASCTPKFHEPTFRKAIAQEGLNPYFLAIANVREHCSFPHSHHKEEATQKAKELIQAAIGRAHRLEAIEKKRQIMNKDILVIGAGVAGLKSSLDLADSGFKVYLIEKEHILGGNMLKLYRTFPDEEEAEEAIRSLIDKVALHKNIHIFTMTEVKESSGTLGNFEIVLLKNPRYVDVRKCNGCGNCQKVCKVRVKDTFNLNLVERTAIYIPQLETWPQIAAIDEEACLALKGEECKDCLKACPNEAIDLRDKKEEMKIFVGAIVVATGFKEYDPSNKQNLGYGRYPNVITQMQLARLIDPKGPTQGKIVSPKSNQAPKNVVMIQCVGSRDNQLTGHPYCSRVCCMVAIKHAAILKKTLGNKVNVTICYMDIRAFGKGYEEYYKLAQGQGVKFVRGRPAEVKEFRDGSLIVHLENTLTSEKKQLPAELVVLSAATEPSEGTTAMFETLGIGKDETNFIKEFHPKLRPCDTSIEGIFVAGSAQGPKDIADSVAMASGAAARAECFLSSDVAEISLEKAYSDRDKCKGCRICEKVCLFEAIAMIETPDGRKAHVEDTLCQGCGVCAGACPIGAMQRRHYTDSQVVAEVEALMGVG